MMFIDKVFIAYEQNSNASMNRIKSELQLRLMFKKNSGNFMPIILLSSYFHWWINTYRGITYYTYGATKHHCLRIFCFIWNNSINSEKNNFSQAWEILNAVPLHLYSVITKNNSLEILSSDEWKDQKTLREGQKT